MGASPARDRTFPDHLLFLGVELSQLIEIQSVVMFTVTSWRAC